MRPGTIIFVLFGKYITIILIYTYIPVYLQKNNYMATAKKRVRDNDGKFTYTFKSNAQRGRMKLLAAKKDTTIQALITKALENNYPLVMADK